MPTPIRIRLRLLRACALVLVSACAGGEPPNGPRAQAPPSILLISIDTLRADRVGCYGYGRDTTPFLDRLAQDSILYEHVQSPAPYTLISHMTMLTGLHPRQHGVLREGLALAPTFPTLAERLHERGYQTAALFFPGWIDDRFGFDRGFDLFEAHSDAEHAGEHFDEWLDQVDPERPYFLFLHLFDVHSGPLNGGTAPLYDSPAPFDRLFLADAPERLAGLDRRDIWTTPGLLDQAQIEAVGAMYDGGIRYVDSKLEAWLGQLDGRGLLEETLVVVTSDHGESLALRDGQMSGHGGVFQDGLHVPLLLRLPGGERGGTRVTDTAGLVDLAPTILAAVGLDFDEGLPGRSLLEAESGAASVYNAQHAGLDVLVQWPWKLVVADEADAAFNLDLDPGEVAPIFSVLTMNLEQRLEDAYQSGLGTSPASLSPIAGADASSDELEKLHLLGYLDE
ncbi:sulfatase [Engelhardtia mirabilis]|uniref:Arylsulfatase n=1 Tax=Engelhardtia mirabilis TaxID=2528011 RepID=A0A518BMW9_9BACT|nr:Arylsulfatase [Planctomycetes bacterium Pla133]QDV02655.1 Arylsulfatase [Planctomycetes bacterium Pla86]